MKIIFFFLLVPLSCDFLNAQNYDLKDCLKYAYTNSPEIAEIALNSVKYESARKQAQDALNPRSSIMAYTAPMYKITGDAFSYDKDYNVWGPYLHAKFQMTMPVFTWGKIDAYIGAADNGIKVSENEKIQKANEVAYEVKKYYYSLLLARTLKTVIEDLEKVLREAVQKAQQMYEAGEGDIKKSDLEKLRVYLATAEKYRHEADRGVIMARLALMQKIGMPENDKFDIKESKLYQLPYKLKDEQYYVDLSFKHRPDWKMIKHGIIAKSLLVDAEKADKYPVLFLAGEVSYDKAWVVKDQKNPWLNDNFNSFYGGVALGAKFDFNIKTLNAKINEKQAEVDQLKEKEKFAREGIPLQVKNSYYAAREAADNIESMEKAVKAADKWVMAAGLTYGIGTGDVKDALEGLAAMAQSKKEYYQAIFNYNIAIAELAKNCGLDDLPDEQ